MNIETLNRAIEIKKEIDHIELELSDIEELPRVWRATLQIPGRLNVLLRQDIAVSVLEDHKLTLTERLAELTAELEAL